MGASPKRSRAQPCGAAPLALRPCSWLPSHTRAKASLPRPLEQGSTMVMQAAAATAASTALPPRCSICKPAWAASGWLVATTLRPNTGLRRLG
jgi:hypothetical protein